MKKVYCLILLALMYAGVVLGQQKVAVYVTGASEEGVNDFIGAYLVDAIVNSTNYQAVERTSDFLHELSKEQNYQRTGAVDDNQISKLGKQFGVQLVCVAKIGKMESKQFVSARLIDVESGTVKSSTKPIIFTMNDVEKSCAAVAVALISSESDMKKPIVSNVNTNTTTRNTASSKGTTEFPELGLMATSIKISSGTWAETKLKCAELKYAGFNDWYLPSKIELVNIFETKNEEFMDGLVASWFWSSTEIDDKKAYNVNKSPYVSDEKKTKSDIGCFCVRKIK